MCIKLKMFSQTSEIPSGVQVEIKGREVTVKSGGRENHRAFTARHVEIKKDDGSVTVMTNSPRKTDRADVGTVMGHINNMMKGVQTDYTCKLKMVYSHFPMTTKHANGVFTVDNFLGEKKPRSMKVMGGVEIKIAGQEITVSGIDKERVGLCASQIEQLCKITKFDRRVFQDGIYIFEKGGKPLK